MPIFQVLTPITPVIFKIDGDDFKDAIKNFVKFNYQMNLLNLIVSDQRHHYRANIRYRPNNNIGIDMYPAPGLYF